MSNNVKDSWKKVGEDLTGIGNTIKESEFGKGVAEFGKDLGKSIVESVKVGAKAVSDWANSMTGKEAPVDAEAETVEAEPVEAEPVETEPCEEPCEALAEEPAEEPEAPEESKIIYD